MCDYIVETRGDSYYISIVGEEIIVRISKKQIEAFNIVNADMEMVAIILAIVEFARNQQKTNNYRPNKIVNKESFRETLKFWIDQKGIRVYEIISRISDMTYTEIRSFFKGDFEEEVDEE